jgi:hypothetical protein
MTSAPPKGGAFTLSDPAAFHFVQRELIAATVVEAGRASRLRTLGSNGTDMGRFPYLFLDSP